MSSVERAAQSRGSRAADHRRPLSLALLVAALTVALVPTAARAQEFSPDEPALDEYTESLPIAEGKRDPSHPARPFKLPSAISRGLARVRGGTLLQQVVSSPALGAPSAVAAAPRRHPRRGKRSDRRGHERSLAPSSGSDASGSGGSGSGALPRGSLASAAAHTGGGGLLLLLLAALTAAAVVVRVLLPVMRGRRGGGR
jgi:hypothetical protein